MGASDFVFISNLLLQFMMNIIFRWRLGMIHTTHFRDYFRIKSKINCKENEFLTEKDLHLHRFFAAIAQLVEH
ncbi:MAG TPA: hypothetical protein DDX07_12045 [Porphyromonadaceae bacterium]|nr:hypothetical protein [Porphyromonadaceae bacterium]